MRKAQIKMGETIAVLVIFFFLLVFGLTFYTKVQSASFTRTLDRGANLKAIQVAQKIAFLPELQCSFRNIQVDNCFDKVKIKVFNDVLEADPDGMKLYYYDLFEYSSIEITQVYPDTEVDPDGTKPLPKKYQIYNLEPPDFKRRLSTQMPVSLYDPLSDTYSMGLLEVKFYSR